MAPMPTRNAARPSGAGPKPPRSYPPGATVALLFWTNAMIARFSSEVSWPSENFGMFSGPESMAA